MNPDSLSQESFLRMMRFCLTLSFAGLAAFISALERVNPAVEFRLNLTVAIASLVAGTITWVLCGRWNAKVIQRAGDGGKRFSLRDAVAPTVCITAGTVLTFAYFLKELSPSTMRDMLIGIATAVVALTALAVLFWRTTCFLRDQDDSPPAEE